MFQKERVRMRQVGQQHIYRSARSVILKKKVKNVFVIFESSTLLWQ